MKILHLSTSLTGGAGVAALRLAEIQALQGHEVEVVSAKEHISTMTSTRKLKNSLASKAFTLYNRGITESKSDSLTPLSFNVISPKEILSRNPSVVHLHNSYNLIDFPEFLRLAQFVPVVATLHDERWLTGGCHLTLGCTKFKETCSDCPQARTMKTSITHSQYSTQNALREKGIPLEVISPSTWIQQQVHSAKWTKDLINVTVIPNAIPNSNSRHLIVKSDEKFLVLIVAASTSLNKGISDAIDAMIEVAQKKSDRFFELRIVGGQGKEKVKPLPNLEIFQDGSVDTITMEEFMSQANLLLVASKSENSPNVISEAQFLKLAVLATNVGGIPELVDDMKTGFLCRALKSDIAQRILEISELPIEVINRISSNAFDIAVERHNPENIQAKTLQVYFRAGASE